MFGWFRTTSGSNKNNQYIFHMKNGGLPDGATACGTLGGTIFALQIISNATTDY
ncbi:MAG: hypothetical protein V2I33_25630 [Kangiellaceae bacterium]|jgi:hypothetical protein|nr:hypothetical protein [Kangiellaceae bacterium]